MSRIDFPGTEFTPEVAAACEDRGSGESGGEWESGPHAGARNSALPPVAVGEPWDQHLWPGSARLVRLPSLPGTRWS